MSDINLVVDPANKETSVSKVRAGSNANEIAICITQSEISDCIIVWDIEQDCEISSIDVGKESRIFYDKYGSTLITQNDEVLICE